MARELLRTYEKYSKTLPELDLLGRLMNSTKDYPSAIRVTEKALLLAKIPQEAYAVRCNLIKLLNETNEPLKALRLIKANQQIKEFDLEMEMEKVFSFFLLNRKDESKKILQELLPQITDESTRSRIKFNLGTYLLEEGKFQEGLKGFIQDGKKIGIWPDDKIPEEKRITSPEDFKNASSILILGDGGIGDEIINIRFLKNNPKLTWYTPRNDLFEIFNRAGFKTVTSYNPEDYEKITTSMQLPIWLESTEESLWSGRYLEPSTESKNKFMSMKESNKLKIGLRWSGNPEYEQNLHRSLDFETIYKIVKEKYPDVELYSLQFPRDTSLDYKDVKDMSSEITNFDDTLAIIDNLDIVITSCTSIAHAAGALDKKTFVFVPVSAYYTWISPHPSREHNESIWYSKNLKILRQEVFNSKEKEYSELRLLL